MKISEAISNIPMARRAATMRESRRARRRRGGSVILLVTLSLVTLLGCGAIAVDYGVLVSDANQMQRASDAAALAGAQRLYTSGVNSASQTYDQYYARQMAMTVAQRNGVSIAASDVTFPDDKSIRVVATRSRSLFFGQALGMSSGRVTREATAGREALDVVHGAVPLAMTTDDYYAYRDGRLAEYELIRNHDEDFDGGSVAALDLRPGNNGKSGAHFQDDFANGYDGAVALNSDTHNALNASINSQSGKLENAMEARFNAANRAPFFDSGSNKTYPNYPVGSPRLVMILVCPPQRRDNNNPTLSAQFFAPVYLQSFRIGNGNGSDSGTCISFRIMPSVTFSSQDPIISLSPGRSPANGPSVVVLRK